MDPLVKFVVGLLIIGIPAIAIIVSVSLALLRRRKIQELANDEQTIGAKKKKKDQPPPPPAKWRGSVSKLLAWLIVAGVAIYGINSCNSRPVVMMERKSTDSNRVTTSQNQKNLVGKGYAAVWHDAWSWPAIEVPDKCHGTVHAPFDMDVKITTPSGREVYKKAGPSYALDHWGDIRGGKYVFRSIKRQKGRVKITWEPD